MSDNQKPLHDWDGIDPSRIRGYSRRQLLAAGMSGLTAITIAPRLASARVKTKDGLEAAGALAFGPGNLLFVGDTKGAAVHAFELRSADIKPQTKVAMGDSRTFQGRDLIQGIDRKLAALLGTSPDQIVINDLLVHRPSKQIFLSAHRGRGPDAGLRSSTGLATHRASSSYIQGIVPAGSIGVHLSLAIAINAPSSAYTSSV
jgi:hypothetical protein